jgi:hypothetical protein
MYLFNDVEFDVTFVEILENSQENLKLLLIKLISEINQNLDVEGLFRLSGDKTKCDEMKQLLEMDINCDIKSFGIHEKVSVLKFILQQYELFPIVLYDDFLLDLDSNEQIVENLFQLSEQSLTILFMLCEVLNKVSKNNKNKMNTKSLASILGPTLIKSNNDQHSLDTIKDVIKLMSIYIDDPSIILATL